MKYFRRMTQILKQSIFYGFLAVGLFLLLPVFVLAAPGDLDSTFGIGGQITTGFNFASSIDVALQADGKIVAAGIDGTQIALARYNADGSLDPSFGFGGRVYTSVGRFSSASGIAIQPDGKIVVAGDSCVFGPICDFAVVRYLANGSLDTSFNGNGRVIIDLGNHNFANDLVIQPDGKIVVVGASMTSEGNSNASFAVARLNSDGALDASFGNGDGKVITSLGNFSDRGASAVALQQDGKIVAAGNTGSSGWATSDFALVRYNTDGSLDATFDGDGKVITAVSSGGDGASEVAIQPDGKIVAAGVAPDNAALVRYNINGSLDASFGGDGIVLTDLGIHDSFRSIAFQANGKIVAGGSNGQFSVARYNSNGSLDASFGGGGIVSISFDNQGHPNAYGGINGIAIQPDGKIVAGGFWGADGEFAAFAVARFIGDTVVSNRERLDFDGDGRSDIAVFRPSEGVWYLNQSTNGFSATQFGLSTDKITPADFDGDGKTDIAVFRDGFWYWLNSSTGSFNALHFGQTGDIPVLADFDGDGRSEIAVYRGGIWYTLNLANNQFQAVHFGLSTDKPVAADYDGDGRSDYAVYRDGIWYLLQSTQGFAAIHFGLPTDKLVPADYDGDGKTDVAVYRDGIWYLQQSGQDFTAFQFGIGLDTPVPADYDGDGKSDVAVYRKGTWYIINSSNESISYQQFGATSDIPVAAANSQ